MTKAINPQPVTGVTTRTLAADAPGEVAGPTNRLASLLGNPWLMTAAPQGAKDGSKPLKVKKKFKLSGSSFGSAES